MKRFAEKAKAFAVASAVCCLTGLATASAASTAENTERSSGSETILLIGSDRRDGTWNGNSDAMLAAKIDFDEKKISLVSFMRDIGAEIPGHGLMKLNAAYAMGGAELLEETLYENFGVETDGYVSTDFEGMIEIVDALGGVDMEVRDAEVDVVNMYVTSMCMDMGLDEEEYLLESGGDLHLNGMQATAFCRVRFVGNSDYERTERQRRILSSMFEAFRPDDAAQAAKTAALIVAKTESKLPPEFLLKAAPELLKLSEYEIETARVPFDGAYSTQGEMLIPSQPDTNERIAALLGTKAE